MALHVEDEPSFAGPDLRARKLLVERGVAGISRSRRSGRRRRSRH